MYVCNAHHTSQLAEQTVRCRTARCVISTAPLQPMFTKFQQSSRASVICNAIMSPTAAMVMPRTGPGSSAASRQLGMHGASAAAAAPALVHAKHRHVACRVLTESAKLDIGSKAPDFELLEPLTGKTVSLASISSGAPATLVMFICNHCPFVVMLKSAIAALAAEYQAKGVAVVAISSNSIQTHPQDGPDKMAEEAKQHGYSFPYLYDATQSVARAYTAACTPEFYVFDSELKLTYHGQFDDARPNNGKPVTGADLRTALDAALAGAALPAGFTPRPSIGCNIKWHPGQEPDYYGSQIVTK